MNVKIGTVILLYSLLITLSFIIGVLYFQYSAPFSTDNAQILPDTSMYILKGQELAEAYRGDFSLDTERITDMSAFDQYYSDQFLRKLMPITVVFCLFLIVSSLLLWRVLKSIQEKQTIILSEKLNAITEDSSFLTGDPALVSAYENIKEKFNAHLNDYKRLNSYLSHEQKNAIAILRTNLELNDNKEYLKSLDYITDSIDDILIMSQNKDISATGEVDAALVCASVCDTYSKLSDSIEFVFNEEDDTVILAKERWITRAVGNLLDNAIKYGEGRPVQVAVKRMKGSVIISVTDHGIGIGKNKQEEIFNHQYRVNELNKDGYGIGLSLVAHVCELCNGFVTVDSEEGQGSTFYLSFPGLPE
ncbi:sensor histidine kinase [Bacillus sp. 1P06AnD]|uniref:sensor histidine kinase n=1 Tax=Bacillus sp. 1P06AnD TaxID=3132208 RepID=UPI0039A0AFC7